jgi:hypothetical protein
LNKDAASALTLTGYIVYILFRNAIDSILIPEEPKLLAFVTAHE